MIREPSDGLHQSPRLPRREASWPVTAGFALLFFAATFRFGIPADVALDPSWAAVLGWSHLHGVRWGHELIFSYGPLGYLQPRGAFDPALYTTFLIGQTLLGIGHTFVYATTFRALDGISRGLFALLALAACRLQDDALLLGCGVLAVVVLDRGVRGNAWARAGLILLALQLNALALMKFTLFAPSVLLAVVGAALFVRERRPFAALGWLGVWSATLLALWLAHGQHLADLLPFVRGGFLLASGYAAALGVDSGAAVLACGLLVFGLVAFALVAWLRRERPTLRTLLLCGYLAACLYLCWRSAFTRADPWHVRFFFPLAGFIVFGLLALARECLARRGQRVLGALTLLCVMAAVLPAIAGRQAPGPADSARAAPGETDSRRERYAAQRETLRRHYDLPAFRRLVGDARVDFFGCEQNVLLLNGFRYAPRPVFQSYAAVNESLQRINEAYYLGENAPAFVIAGLCAIDGHAPGSEDGLALLALLRAYRPVAAENGYALLQRVAAADVAPLAAFDGPYRIVQPGEWIDIPPGGTPQVLHLRYTLSPTGTLRALLLREPVLLLDTQAADGELRQFRLVRTTANAGFLVSPQLSDAADYRDWYGARASRQVRRLRVRFADPGQAHLFGPHIEAGFTEVSLLQAAASDP